MDLRYSRHAEERLEQQGITQAMVEAVLQDPQWTPATSHNTRYDAMVGDRRLCVIVAEEHPIPVVVTAFWYIEEN